MYYYDTLELKVLSEKQKADHIANLVELWQNIANINLAVPADLRWYNHQYQGLKRIYYYI